MKCSIQRTLSSASVSSLRTSRLSFSRFKSSSVRFIAASSDSSGDRANSSDKSIPLHIREISFTIIHCLGTIFHKVFPCQSIQCLTDGFVPSPALPSIQPLLMSVRGEVWLVIIIILIFSYATSLTRIVSLIFLVEQICDLHPTFLVYRNAYFYNSANKDQIQLDFCIYPVF